MIQVDELKKDSEEIQSLLSSASRQSVKDILIKAKAEIDREIANAELKAKLAVERQQESGARKRYLKELQEYAWDQSAKYVKLFVNLEGVEKIDEANVECNFTENSMKIVVRDLHDRDYCLTVNNLLEKIDVNSSYRKVKSGMVAIYMKKVNEDKHWDTLTTIQKRLKEKSNDEFKNSDDADPQSALVNIMKKMYNSGDTQTKQMIAKAWTESQEKMVRGDPTAL